VELDGAAAALSWPQPGTAGAARLELPGVLRWSLHWGETDPILGWYSPGLGCRVPAFALVGHGCCLPGTPLATRLEFLEAGLSAQPAISRQVVSWFPPGARACNTSEIRAEAT
jgi:hypothetical protein